MLLDLDYNKEAAFNFSVGSIVSYLWKCLLKSSFQWLLAPMRHLFMKERIDRTKENSSYIYLMVVLLFVEYFHFILFWPVSFQVYVHNDKIFHSSSLPNGKFFLIHMWSRWGGKLNKWTTTKSTNWIYI